MTSSKVQFGLVLEWNRLHRESGPLIGAAGFVLVLVFAALVWTPALTQTLAEALGPVLGALALRLLLGRAEAGAAMRDARAAAWLWRYRGASALIGAAWTLAGWLLIPRLDATGFQTLLFVQLIVSGGALGNLGFDLVAAMLLALPPVMQVALHVARSGAPQWQGLMLFLIALPLMAVLRGLRWRRTLEQAIELREAAADSAEELRASAAAADLARRELADKHQLLEALMQTTRQGYWFVDTEGITVDLNDSMCALLGRPREAVLGRPAFDFFAGDDLATLRREIAQRQSGVASSYTIGIERPDGSRVECFNHATPIRDAAGRRIGSVGIWSDVTAWRQNEQELRAYKVAVNSLGDMVSVMGPDRVYHLVNDAWCRFTGWTREAAVGRTSQEVMPWAFSEARTRAFRESVERLEPRSVRGPAQLPGVGQRIYETTYHPYVDESGGVRCVIVARDVSEQENARAAIDAGAEYLRRTLNATGDAIFAAEAGPADAPLRFANEQLLQMWGIPAGEAAPLSLAGLMARVRPLFVDAEAELKQISAIVAADLPSQTRVVLRDGRVLQRRFVPARVGDNVVRIWSFRDITAEASALAAAEAREAEQRALLEAFPGVITRVDQRGVYTYVNRARARLEGLEPGQMIGRPIAEVLGAQRFAALRSLVERAFAGEALSFEQDYLPPAARGAAQTVRTTLALGSDPGTGQAAVYAFGIDVSEAKRAEQALRSSERETRALLDAFPGSIGAVDRALRYIYVNERFAAQFGRLPEEIVGRSLREVVGEADFAALASAYRRAWEGLQPVFESGRPAADGRPRREFEVTLVAGERRADGAQTCYAFGQDITARKIAEEALIAARDEAEEANRAKSRFLSQMSHELRTPLNAILGFGQLLGSDPRLALSAVQRSYIEEILRGARHLLDLINEVLDLGRVESGQLEVELGDVGLQDLVDECLALLRPLALERDVKLPASGAAAQGRGVRADRTRLKQVLLNLLGNAVKYNRRSGAVMIEFRDDGDAVRIGIRDSGHGLSAEDCARLFQPFERLGAAQSGVEGTGIGLALSRRLAEAMGGSVGVESEPGVGSLFWVRLARARPGFAPAAAPPLPLPALAALPQPPQPQPPPMDSAPPRPDASVLYIEDNPVNVFVMESMFERLPGLRLLSAATPSAGLQMARSLQPGLILLDVQLPEMDGVEVLRRLRAHESTRSIPVVAVSANAMPEEVQTVLAAGAQSYLTKPVDLDQLLDTVRSVLGDQVLAQEQRAD